MGCGSTVGGGGGRQPAHAVAAAKSDMDLSRRNRKKERGRLKAGEQPLLDPWSRSGTRESNANTIGTATSTHQIATSGNNNSNNNNNSGNNNNGNSSNIDCNGAER